MLARGLLPLLNEVCSKENHESLEYRQLSAQIPILDNGRLGSSPLMMRKLPSTLNQTGRRRRVASMQRAWRRSTNRSLW